MESGRGRGGEDQGSSELWDRAERPRLRIRLRQRGHDLCLWRRFVLGGADEIDAERWGSGREEADPERKEKEERDAFRER